MTGIETRDEGSLARQPGKVIEDDVNLEELVNALHGRKKCASHYYVHETHRVNGIYRVNSLQGNSYQTLGQVSSIVVLQDLTTS